MQKRSSFLGDRKLNPLVYLEENVYGSLNDAMIQLIEVVIKTDEVRKHQERLKEQKVLDRLEQKRVEKEKLKEELGSDYESSEESFAMDEFDMGKPEEVEDEKANAESNKDIASKQEGEGGENDEKKKKHFTTDLGQIEEDDERDPEDQPEHDAEQVKEIIKKQRDAFNPLLFLANALKTISENNFKQKFTKK